MPDTIPGLPSNANLYEAVLSKFYTRDKEVGVVNNLLLRKYILMELLKNKAKAAEGGKDCTFDTMLIESSNAGFQSMFSTRQPKREDVVVRGSLPWSLFEWHAAWADEEEGFNRGQGMIYSVIDTRQDAANLRGASDLEDALWAQDGNYDKIVANPIEKPPFPGFKFGVTRDGYAPNGTGLVYNIDPTKAAYARRWHNHYAGPNGNNLNKASEHSATEKLTSANQLVKFMRRAMRWCAFENPKGMDLKATPDNAMTDVKSQRIFVDDIAQDALEILLDNKSTSDSMTNKEVTTGEVAFRGMPLTHVPHLGLDGNGLPATCAHADVGGGALTAGTYANTGEVLFLRMNRWKLTPLAGFDPKRMPVAFIELQQAYWLLWKLIMTLGCVSRREQCYLWGFSRLQTK